MNVKPYGLLHRTQDQRGFSDSVWHQDSPWNNSDQAGNNLPQIVVDSVWLTNITPNILIVASKPCDCFKGDHMMTFSKQTGMSLQSFNAWCNRFSEQSLRWSYGLMFILLTSWTAQDERFILFLWENHVKMPVLPSDCLWRICSGQGMLKAMRTHQALSDHHPKQKCLLLSRRSAETQSVLQIACKSAHFLGQSLFGGIHEVIHTKRRWR